MKTIAIDFDGVIHKYSKGYNDGTAYDVPMEGAFEAIRKMFANGYAVYVLSTRPPLQIKEWLDKYSFSIITEIIADDVKFWNKLNIVGITNRKLPFHAMIDDRAIRFTNWTDVEKYFT